MKNDRSNTRRATAEEVQAAMRARPSRPWTVPDQPLDATHFVLRSTVDLQAVRGTTLPGLPDINPVANPRLNRMARIWVAGDFVRTEDLPVDDEQRSTVRGLEHPELGAVYIDLADRSYLHFGAGQLARAPVPSLAQGWKVDFAVSKEKQGTLLRVRGTIRLDLEFRTDADAPAGAAAALLRACLPGLDDLVQLGLPLQEIVSYGAPIAVTVWHVGADGARAARLAHHECHDVRREEVPPDHFAIPEGIRDLRADPELKSREPQWTPVRRARRGVRSGVRRSSHAIPSRNRGETEVHARTEPSMAAIEMPGAWQLPTTPSEPSIPSCQPATYHVSSAVQIEQTLLDSIQYLANLLGSRMTGFSAARVAPAEPANTQVRLTVPWLEQLQTFSESGTGGGGDALFCLLRDAPTEPDLTGGGRGLIDRAAATLAQALLAVDEPLPFGGADAPIVLPAAVEAAITVVILNNEIAPDDRFEALLPHIQAQLREEVLLQRIAVWTSTFEGDFGEHLLPSPEFALIHVHLNLESLMISIGDRLVETLQIETDMQGNPELRTALRLNEVSGHLHMERWPGIAFWITAGTVIVGLGIASAVAGPVIVAMLIGMGPLGWALLATMLAGAGTAALAGVAGGLLLAAAVTYLVWDQSDLRLRLVDATVTSVLQPVANERRVALGATLTELEGEMTVEVSSQIPSGMHQIFDMVVNAAIPAFEGVIRDLLATRLGGEFTALLQSLPHLHVPPPAQIMVPVPLENAPVEAIDVRMPRHGLLENASNGSPERMLAMSALTRFESPLGSVGIELYPTLQPYLTQVERDPRETLSAVLAARREAGGNPILGYALSQNLLNGIVFARWLSRRLEANFDEAATEEAFAALVEACPACGAIDSDRQVYARVAGPPRVLVANRAYDEDERRPYLLLDLPDVRLCLSGIAKKPSTLEIRFAVTGVAHLEFGEIASTGEGRTLWTQGARFVDVKLEYFALRRLAPVETQSLVASGPGFDSIATLDSGGRLALLEQLQPLLQRAADHIVWRNRARQLQFAAAPAMDRQVYDGFFHARIVPHGTSLFVSVELQGPLRRVLPRRGVDGQLHDPEFDLDGEQCAYGEGLRALTGIGAP